MADPIGQSPDPLAALAALEARPGRFTLFAALRLLEGVHAGEPRLGESRKAADDAVRLAQPPHLIFAPSDVSAYRTEGRRRPQLEQYSFGIFGPNGALPLHLTEYAHERERQHDDPTVRDFVNTFQHRLIALFYRAWADADPATNFDRPPSDRFATYVGAFIGLAPPSARHRDSVIDYAKLSRCGLFAPQTRSAEGLASILSDYFELPIRVEQFIGAWLEIPADAYCRLGGERDSAALGLGATLGTASWQCQHKFEIVVGPLTLAQFSGFLPGTAALEELRALVRLYTNDEWSWQLRPILQVVEVPGVTLGRQGRLGWTTWLDVPHRAADDVVIQGDDRWYAKGGDDNG
jgi:type VI secretion system protein ImpH